MRFCVTRREKKYWFWQYNSERAYTAGNQPDGFRYMSLMYGYYDPETRIITGDVCSSARLAGTKWVSMAANAPKTRRPHKVMCRWMWLCATLLEWTPTDGQEHYISHADAITAAEDMGL